MTKKILIAVAALVLVVGLVVVLNRQPSDVTTNGPASDVTGSVRSIVDRFVNGLVLGSQQELWIEIKLARGEQYNSVINPLGVTLYPDYWEIITTGTASSTIYAGMGTTSAQNLTVGGPGLSIYVDGTARKNIYATTTGTKDLPYLGFVDFLRIATSTIATTTSSNETEIFRAGKDVARGNNDWGAGEYLYLLAVTGGQESLEGKIDTVCVATNELANICESATSTVLFGTGQIKARIRVHN